MGHTAAAADQTTSSRRQQRVPATFAQQRLWFLEQLQPGNLAYLIAWNIRLSGDLHLDALERALHEIVRRHKIFRTTFGEANGDIVQVISSSQAVPVALTDLSATDDPEGIAGRIAREETTQAFDLVGGPLLRVRVLRMGATEHRLLITLHHIIFDGSSRAIFLRELSALYGAFREDRPSPLPEPKIQYADYAVWQRRSLEGKRYPKLLDYWKQQLADAPAVLALPHDHSRPAQEAFRGASKPFELPEGLSAKLNVLARKHGASLFMVLAAGFQTLLAKYSGQDDILIGVPVAGRAHPEFENLIGFFANEVVLRLRFDQDASFDDLIAQSRNVAFEAFEHQDMPFDRLVQELNPGRTLSHNPLFQAVFSLRNIPREDFRLAGLERTEFGVTAGNSAKVDLAMFLEGGSERQGIAGRIEFNLDLFDPSTIDRMAAHFRTLLTTVAAHPELPVSKVSMLTPEEEHRIVVEWNDTAADYPRDKCVHQLFEEHAANTPDAPALLFGGSRLSYGELDRDANQLARHLLALGVKQGDRVGIYLERSLDLMVALLAVMKAGAAYVPLDPNYPAARIELILEDAFVSCLLTTSAICGRLAAFSGPTVVLDEEAAAVSLCSHAPVNTPVAPEDLIYIIFTSGSTGRPKGVEVSHGAVLNLLNWMATELGMGAGDVFPALASFGFDMSVPELYLPLTTGATLALAESHLAGNGEELALFLRQHRATIVHATPTTWSLLLEAGFTGAGLKRCIGAEPLPFALFERLMKAAPGTPLWNFYGPTETTVWSTSHRFMSPAEPIVVGRPISNTQVYILSASDQVCPIGVAGEIHIAGDGIARGYRSQPGLTAAKFVSNPFHPNRATFMYKTSDLGKWLSDGTIEHLGRMDHQVKIRGFRIELGEIEAALAQHEDVNECIVIAREDQPGNKRLIAYVVPAPHKPVVLEEFIPALRLWLSARLPEYMVPTAIVMLKAMPLSANGKIDRKALPEPDYAVASGAYVAPRTLIEEQLSAIWAEVLKLPQVSVEANFFALGGHSLLATQVVSRIRRTFEVELPLRALFETPTVAGLAAAIDTLTASSNVSVSPATHRADRSRPIPLSFAQQRLWFLEQLEPNNPLYNAPSIMRLSGLIVVEALQAALTAMVERHETLRTRFDEVDGEPVQIIEPPHAFALTLTDLTEVPAEVRLEEARRLAIDAGATPFDLKQGQLARASLIRLTLDDHVIVLNTHHSISDGWSMDVFWRELATLYEAGLNGTACELAPLQLQYADYAVWQRAFLAGEEQVRQLAYWKVQLAGAPPVLELPTDRPRPRVESFRGERHYIYLPADILKSLRALCQREDVTLFMALLAAWNVLLARHSGQHDVVVGSQISGRNHAEWEGLIGLFTNTLVLRTSLGGDPTFQDVLERVRETTLGAYSHQDIPFERLVEELQPDRDLSRNPIFQVMLVLITAAGDARHLGAALAETFPIRKQSSKFDLTLYAAEHDDRLRLSFEYNTDLFDAATIDRMAQHFANILEAVATDVRTPALRIPMLSGGEQRNLLTTWNDTARLYPREARLPDLFEQQVERTPYAIATASGSDRRTYFDLNAHANQLAHDLVARGIGPGSLVGVCMQRTQELLVALLGVAKTGAAYLPLDPNYPQERLGYILDDAQTRLVITETSVRDMLPSFEGETLCLDAEWPAIAQRSTSNLHASGDADDLAYVLHTSGSTGKPKGVEITHRNLVNFLLSMQREPGIAPGDVLLAVTTLSFDISGLELYLPLIAGACVVVASREDTTDATQLMALLRRHDVTIMQATPATWSMLLEAGWKGDARLKVLCGGEALPPELAAQLVASVGEMWNMYGPTETTIWSSVARIDAENLARITIGHPIANTTMYVLDSARQLVPVGVAGELYIGGEGVGRGYWRKPELTAERFVADPFVPGERLYRTGDLAKVLPDGSIQCLGRIDFQVKVRGHRIELGEIEIVLAQDPALVECVAVVREDSPGDKRIVAYVVMRAEGASTAQLRKQVAERLPDYMVPSAIVLLAELPRTANGKVDRKALPAPDHSDSGAPEYTAPRTPAEEMLCEIWAEVLKLPRVGIADNFFELGGHSLLATRMIARIRDTFQIELPVRALFESPTIAGLAERIAAKHLKVAAAPIENVPADVAVPLSFTQQRLWFLAEFEPESPFYNIPWAVRLGGELDDAALERALDALMQRHDSLRTRFAVTSVGSEPVQLVSNEETLPLTRVDLSALSAAAREEEALRLIQAEARRPFKVSVAPLFRILVLRLGEQENILLINLHHAIADGWSLGVISEELATLYEAFRAGATSPLKPLALQYRDYAAWQRQYMTGDVLAEKLAYWKQHLAGAPPAIELPTDRPRPAQQVVDGAKLVAIVPAETLTAIKALARREGSTLFITLFSAFNVLLSRYSGQQDLVVGTAIAGRDKPATEALIGYFANTLALRSDLSGEPTFLDQLRRTRASVLTSYAHADMPFEKLVEELNPVRDMSRSPLFQVMFVQQNAFERSANFGSLAAEAVPMSGSDAKVDLILNVSEQAGTLRCALEYSTALYDAETIERMLAHYGTLLTRLAQDPAQKITEVSFLGEEERHRLLVEWNQTDADYPRDKCLHQLFEEQVLRTPNNTAIIFGDASLTFADLNKAANQLAEHLLHSGVKPGDRVAIYVERSLRMPIALLAVQKCGAAYIPLDPGYPPERSRMVIEDAEIACLVTEQLLLEGVPEYAGPIINLDNVAAAIASLDGTNLDIPVSSGDLIYVIFTSGSTGRPKGVEVCHRNVVNYLCWAFRQMELTSQDVFVALSSYAFDMCIPELYGPLITGGSVVISSREVASNGEDLARLLIGNQVTAMVATPTTWAMLLDAGFAGKQIKRMIGGEPLPRELFRRLMHAGEGSPLLHVYGPTETTVICVTHRFTDPEELIVIGRPGANMQLYVLDRHMQPVPVGVNGKLYVAGDGVTRGYLARPDLTELSYSPNPFSAGSKLYDTGDIVRYHPDGSIEYVGRADLQVKIRGFRIELGEIETALSAHPAVRECVVIAREDDPGNKFLAAYIVAQDGNAAIDFADLRKHLRDRLPEYMVPRGWMQIEFLPLSPTGKVDRNNLPTPPADDGERADDSRSRTPLEEIVASTFCDVLNLGRIGLDENFFEAGGHSLSATRVVGRLRHALSIEIPLRVLFEAPTVAGVAERITHLQRSDLGLLAPPLIAVPRDRDLVLSFAQQRLWFVAQMDPDNPLYNTPSALRLKGTLHIAALQQAIESLVARHEVLRTRYVVHNDEPVQIIDPHQTVALPLVDLTALPASVREAEALRLLDAEAQKPFQLATDPMLRAMLVRLDDDEHILLLNSHHIATDGWSNAVLLRDLTTFYAAALGQETGPLPPLPIQYADYAVWQRNWLQGAVLEGQLAFWRKALAGAPPILQIPTDRPRPEFQTFSGGLHVFQIPAERMAALQLLARREGATSFMLLIAAFQMLIAYLTRQSDIVLGTDLANRTAVQTEDLIGFFVNLMVVRADLSGDPTFIEHLARVRHYTLDAYAHQDVPFDKLVEELAPERSRSHNPLVQVLFVQQNTPRNSTKMDGLELSSVRLGLPSKFDMAVFVRETAEGLVGGWQYNADLFDAATIQKMAALFGVVLESIQTDPDTKLSAIHSKLADWELEKAIAAQEQARALSRKKLTITRRTAVTT